MHLSFMNPGFFSHSPESGATHKIYFDTTGPALMSSEQVSLPRAVAVTSSSTLGWEVRNCASLSARVLVRTVRGPVHALIPILVDANCTEDERRGAVFAVGGEVNDDAHIAKIDTGGTQNMHRPLHTTPRLLRVANERPVPVNRCLRARDDYVQHEGS